MQSLSFNPRSCARSDPVSASRPKSLSGFNPRSCARSDEIRNQGKALSSVSIHAPVQGATIEVDWDRRAMAGFNPRSCARSDKSPARWPRVWSCFNPRSCARSDPFLTLSQRSSSCFNPRSCARSDMRNPKRVVRIKTSFNPRSCARSDTAPPVVDPPVKVFQSTLLCKERRNVKLDLLLTMVSIHAPVQGATTVLTDYFGVICVSIHAPVQGATLTPRLYYKLSISFNPRSCARSDSIPSKRSIYNTLFAYFREPPLFFQILPYKYGQNRPNPYRVNIANFPGNSCSLGVRAKFFRADQKPIPRSRPKQTISAAKF
jgi:hypothetical protein